MKEEQLDQLWRFIEKHIGSHDDATLPWTRQAALALILDCQPELIARRIRGSALPARAVMEWLARQARRIPSLDQERLQQLQRCLDQDAGKGPKAQAGLRRDKDFARKMWDTLEKNIMALDQSAEFNPELIAATRTAMIMMYECHPQLIVECIEQSPLPTRALVSWLIFEGQRMPVLDTSRVQGLKEYWERYRREEIIPAPESEAARPAALQA